MTKDMIKHAVITGIIGGTIAALVTFFLCIGYVELLKYRAKVEMEERIKENSSDSIFYNSYGRR